MRRVTQSELRDVERLLAGAHQIPLGGDEQAVMVFTRLPGRAVVASVRVDGVLWIVLDDEKALSRRHAAEAIADARAAAVPDQLQRAALSEHQPLRLRLVG